MITNFTNILTHFKLGYEDYLNTIEEIAKEYGSYAYYEFEAGNGYVPLHRPTEEEMKVFEDRLNVRFAYCRHLDSLGEAYQPNPDHRQFPSWE